MGGSIMSGQSTFTKQSASFGMGLGLGLVECSAFSEKTINCGYLGDKSLELCRL